MSHSCPFSGLSRNLVRPGSCCLEPDLNLLPFAATTSDSWGLQWSAQATASRSTTIRSGDDKESWNLRTPYGHWSEHRVGRGEQQTLRWQIPCSVRISSPKKKSRSGFLAHGTEGSSWLSWLSRLSDFGNRKRKTRVLREKKLPVPCRSMIQQESENDQIHIEGSTIDYVSRANPGWSTKNPPKIRESIVNSVEDDTNLPPKLRLLWHLILIFIIVTVSLGRLKKFLMGFLL